MPNNPSRIPRSFFAGAVVLSSLQAACALDDIADDADAGLASVEQAVGSGSGSGSGSNSCEVPDTCTTSCGRSCAEIPVPGQGRYPARKGSGWAKTTYTYTLRATKFDVAGTLGLGKHTGVGFTERILTEGEARWCEDTNGDGVGDTTVMSPSSSLTPDFWVSSNHNHGRTVDTAKSGANGTVTFVTGGKQPVVYREAMEACVGLAQMNGFCDSVCGNDSYTVPDLAAFDEDPHPTDVTPFSNRKNYGMSATSDPARWSHMYTTSLDHRRVPRYGHNSNSDANAQNAMMGQCNTFRGWLDGAYDVMVKPSLACEPDYNAIGAKLNGHIRTVCTAHCGGLRLSTYPNITTGDTNNALSDSSLTGPTSTVNTGSVNVVPAGNYIEGTWVPAWLVRGM